MQQVGVPIAPDKCEGPATRLTFLGIEVDTTEMQLCLLEEKLKRVQATVTEWLGATCFNPLWFKSYEWLEYSLETDDCFCYPCRMFVAQGSQYGSPPESTFTLTGFTDWRHATGKNGVLAQWSC